jgi:hypothetical protein
MDADKESKWPELQAKIDAAGGVLQRSEAGKKQEANKTGSARGVLPAKGDTIETQWTGDDEDCGNWFTAVVLLPDVPQLQARQEGRKDGMRSFIAFSTPGPTIFANGFFSTGPIAPPGARALWANP